MNDQSPEVPGAPPETPTGPTPDAQAEHDEFVKAVNAAAAHVLNSGGRVFVKTEGGSNLLTKVPSNN